MRAMFAELVSFCSTPSNVLALLVMGGMILVLLRRKWTTMIAAVALGAVALAMLSPLGTVLLTPLEERFPDAKFPDDSIDGIIVLGGSYDTQIHSYLSTILLEEDTEPMAAVPDLARHYPRALIIFSGGTDPSDPKVNEAAIVKRYFISFGIDPNRIVIEDKSLTTSENARFTAQLIHPKPEQHWLLVSSAYHLPRAIGAFRKVGFNISAFSVGRRTDGWDDLWRPASSATDNLRRIDVAVHEWVGLVWYRLSGYSDEWFAGPQSG